MHLRLTLATLLLIVVWWSMPTGAVTFMPINCPLRGGCR